MKNKTLPGFQAESIEEKTRWFRSPTVEERAAKPGMFTEMALASNPELGIKKHARPDKGRILVLSKA